MRALYCSWALLLWLAAPAAAQQPPAAQSRTYLVFLNGAAIGREDMTLSTTAEGTTISAVTRIGGPVNVENQRSEVRYTRDWTPESLRVDGRVAAANVTLNTTFQGTSATSQGSDAGRPIAVTDTIEPRTFALPSAFFSAHEALGRALANGGDATREFHAFVAPGVDVPFRIRSTTAERVQTGTATFPVKRYELLFANPTGELVVTLVTTEEGALVRLSAPAQGLDVIREDAASATSRTQLYSNPGDEPVLIPAAGFNLGATLTKPQGTALPARVPAVVLVGGSNVNDRDGYVAGIPVLGQLAGALANAGFFTVRYDKRGFGQSGGRAESATLTDTAEDARVIVRWLAQRKVIDPKRIAIVGHSEGAWVGLLAARDRRVAAVVAIAAAGSTGAELVLEQQRHALEQLKTPPEEQQQKIALQQKIQSAVLSGTGWEGVPPALRRQADTPYFQSLLAFDPAKVVDDVRQPILFVHGDLDRQVPVDHAERITALARTTGKSKSVELVTVRGVNHLLVPATTGEVSEYASLPDRNISREATTAISGWLTRTFAAIR
jgi:dipeptidyl aminopeptidase/acylaminoacyl peptidase